MLSAPGGGGNWERPLAALREGIEKLRNLTMNEADPVKKSELNLKIEELETRADNYLKVMQLQGRG